MRIRQWFRLPRSDVPGRAPRRLPPFMPGVEGLELRTLLSTTGPGRDLAASLLRPDQGPDQGGKASSLLPSSIVDQAQGGSGNSGPGYPALQATAPAPRGELVNQPAPAGFAAPVTAADGKVPASGVAVAPAVLPGSVRARGVVASTAGTAYVDVKERVSTTVAARASDIVFREHLVAVAGHHGEVGQRHDASLVHTRTPGTLQPSRLEQDAAPARRAANLPPEEGTGAAASVVVAAPDTGLPAPLPTLAQASGTTEAEPGSHTWLQSLALSATAVLEAPSFQNAAVDTAGILAGCLVAYSLQRSLVPARETARRSGAVPRQRP
jgi:hypothetical protein